MRTFVSVALATTLFAPHAMADPMTFAAALSFADKSAPSLAAKTADMDAAQASARAAGRLPDPKVRVGVENFPSSGRDAGSFSRDSMTMTTVGVIQDMPNIAKRRAEKTRAEADIDLTEANRHVEQRTVKVAAAMAWLALYYAKRELASLDDAAQAIQTLRSSAPSQLASGGMRPAQTLEADQLSAALEDQRAQLVSNAGKARADLVRWTGDPTAEVTGTAPDFAVDADSLRHNIDTLPSLNLYNAMSQQAEADVALARAAKRPDWGWDVTYQHRDASWGDMVSAGVTLSLPLFSYTRQDPIIDARNQTATRVRLERDAAQRQWQAQLDADLADHLMHHDRLMRAQTTLVPLAQQRADLERSSYAAGTASLSDVLQAQLALAVARIDLLSREADVTQDAARIALIYGSDYQ